MQTQQHDDMFNAQLEHYVGEDDAPGSEPGSGENGAGESGGYELRSEELGRYDEEEIVTKPWPPLRW